MLMLKPMMAVSVTLTTISDAIVINPSSELSRIWEVNGDGCAVEGNCKELGA